MEHAGKSPLGFISNLPLQGDQICSQHLPNEMHWAEITCPCRTKNGLKAQISSARRQPLLPRDCIAWFNAAIHSALQHGAITWYPVSIP